MRYIIDLNQNHANQIESLIRKGKYESFAQFIVTAVENQIHIEKTELEGERFEGPSKKTPRTEKYHPTKEYSIEEAHLDLSVPATLPRTVPPPPFSELSCTFEEVEEEKCWLWGQINKIFPMKVGLRALLKSIGTDEWMDLESFRYKAADAAWICGKKIISYEEKKNKKRDERISAGLPIGVEKFKSKMRYRGHFLAFMRKDGKLDGAMALLRFVNLTKNENGNVAVGITDAGLHFACLDNPVIDQKNFETSLSEEEISFYMDHISENVKAENAAIKWLLEKLAGGITQREELNRELKGEFGDHWETSDAVINTQRAGLMARMIELGLIDRVRKGIRVYYYISDSGKEFLRKANES